MSDLVKPWASATAKLIGCDYFRHHLGGQALRVRLVVHLGGAGRGGKRTTNLNLNQTRRTKIKRLNNQLFTMACWELVPFTSDLQVTYGGLFTFCYWFMFFQKGEIPPVDFDCFPVCLSPPTPPPSSIWFRLICPEVSGTKEVVGFLFMAKQKVDYFSRKVQAHSRYECESMLSDSSLHTGCYSSHVFVCHTNEQLQLHVLHATARDFPVETVLPVPLVPFALWIPQVEAGLLVLRSCSKDSKSL